MPRELAGNIHENASGWDQEIDPQRRQELLEMAENLSRVPWEPARNFWEAVQSLWLIHMLVMSDENYPGPGVSFGRLDQYLYPVWEQSSRQAWTRSSEGNPEMLLAALQHGL
jgi:formate C-acetyltransferase